MVDLLPDLLNCKDKLDNCDEYDGGNLCTDPTFHVWKQTLCSALYWRRMVLLTFDKLMVAGPSGVRGTDVTLRAIPALASTNARAPTLHRRMGYLALEVIVRQACCHSVWPSSKRARRHVNSIKIQIQYEHKSNGAWSSWERWNVCSITCGGGTKSRQRHCNNPPPSPSGQYCDGSSEQTMICNNSPCPVKSKMSSMRQNYFKKCILAKRYKTLRHVHSTCILRGTVHIVNPGQHCPSMHFIIPWNDFIYSFISIAIAVCNQNKNKSSELHRRMTPLPKAYK
ncbi:HMCN1-like protein, partial [Mya arenaria]